MGQSAASLAGLVQRLSKTQEIGVSRVHCKRMTVETERQENCKI